MVAHVERELPQGGTRSFVLWADPERRSRFWWYMWWLLFPVRVAIGMGSLLSGSGDAARGPRRIIRRAGPEASLEFRSDGDEIHVHAPWVDWRPAAALATLVRTFDSWMGTPWDDKRS